MLRIKRMGMSLLKMKSKIVELHNNLIAGKIQVSDLIKKSKELDAKYSWTNSTLANTYSNAISIANDIKVIDKNNLLIGIPYSLKDIISTSGIITTGGSKFYKDYNPVFNATVYDKLLASKAILVSKANCDEYGMGGTGLYSGFGEVYNYLDKTKIIGGSGSGNANHVGSETVVFSIGSDTGDSIRRPASFGGVCGYKPTYGLISRYGVFAYACSMDHVGVFAPYVADCAIVAENIIDFDPKDYSSQKISNSSFYKNIKAATNIKLGVIKGCENYMTNEAKKIYLNTVAKLKANKVTIKEFEFDNKLWDIIDSLYMVIANGEGVSNRSLEVGIQAGINNNLDGYENTISDARGKGFGLEVKRRCIIGTYVTQHDNFEKIFLKAQKVRTLINDFSNSILKQVDGILLPAASSLPLSVSGVLSGKEKSNKTDDLLQLANFNGMPSITIPVNRRKDPFGINITCQQFKDQDMFNIALAIEDIIGDNE